MTSFETFPSFDSKTFKPPLPEDVAQFQAHFATLINSDSIRQILLDSSEASLVQLKHEMTKSPSWTRSKTFLDLASEFFLATLAQKHFPVEPTFYNFISAFVYTRERLLQLGFGFRNTLMSLNKASEELNLRLTLEARKLAVDVERLVRFFTPPLFFHGLLQFCAHFAKHGLSAGLGVKEYWLQAQTLLSVPYHEIQFQHDTATVAKDGWVLKIAMPKNSREYIKTLYRSSEWSKKKMQLNSDADFPKIE
ncbi:hypothetical protein L596_029930 [Steinernema carpocapsae]|uniref:Uncharacterized protein n=1 Tax=Steinernema carpocapsae TaxID=34508 RepID=A0A4U5LR78_STECR|nr:hypothetical protein L596_029930 [Steinernema carpocapsae]